MSLAEHTVIHERKLFAGGQLASTLIAGKARQMEDQIARSSHPVGGGDAATAFRALGAEISAIIIKKINCMKRERKLLLMFVKLYFKQDNYFFIYWARFASVLLAIVAFFVVHLFNNF